MLYGSVDGNLVEINVGYDEEEETLTYSKGNDYGTFEKFKLTLSCNGAKVDQPYTLEKDEYCEITFSGDATISNDYILHDSDICRIGIKRYRVVANLNISYTDDYSWLDTLEKNGELGSNQIESQLRSHFFMANSNTDSISINREYEFMYDYREPLLNALYEYAQYGIRGTTPLNVIISPNMEFKVCEIVSSWGYIKKREFTAKLIDSISAPNNEDGIVSIKLTLGIQGE